jgi:hypothetical protein
MRRRRFISSKPLDRRRLSLSFVFGNVRAVNSLSRLPLLAVLVLVTGCRTTEFTKLRVTNHRGELIAEWTAKGSISATERGYRITAVERLSGPPYSTYTRYPDGWRTNAVGPHILHWRCPKPLWLAELDGDVTSITETHTELQFSSGK